MLKPNFSGHIKSYLNRYQRTVVDSLKSNEKLVTCVEYHRDQRWDLLYF